MTILCFESIYGTKPLNLSILKISHNSISIKAHKTREKFLINHRLLNNYVENNFNPHFLSFLIEMISSAKIEFDLLSKGPK